MKKYYKNINFIHCLSVKVLNFYFGFGLTPDKLRSSYNNIRNHFLYGKKGGYTCGD